MAKRSTKGKALSLYANLAARRRSKADAKARRKAEYLASLPKQPLKRLLYRLHPKRLAKFWFSKRGALALLKITGVAVVILAIFIAALFAYYRRELDAISPERLAMSVQTTVTKYYDRNGVLLYEDKGDEDYKIVVDGNDIAPVMKQATVAVEDKEFYKHGGISFSGIVRATFTNLTGGEVQGASTLTQQLIKQVFFKQDSLTNRLDIGRKLKEAILSIEVERMYTKEQILNLYLNTVPYGGPRNGVESAARQYFGIPAKDLNIPQAALIAAIPKNPSRYNPYRLTPETAPELIDRQHLVLNDMVGQGYITKEQAEQAKAVPILDTLQPEFSGNEDMKAPWFVLEVREQLRNQLLTPAVVGQGGLVVKTTLDWRIQEKAQQSITANYKNATALNADNMAFSAIDVPTGQVLAMVGSYDFNDKKLGATNVALAHRDPGSSIKPFVYATLFKARQGQNFGAGSIIVDKKIKSMFNVDIQNYDGNFMGPLSVRYALGMSRNPPAVQAASIAGLDNFIQTTKDAGNRFYCNNTDPGLPAAIGTCGVTLVQHTNAYATLARQGEFKPESYILEVKNAQGQVIHQWKDDQSKKVLDPQITYIISDILTDDAARSGVFGSNARGFNIRDVKTATKTGTTDDGAGSPRDNWMMSYTPRMAVGVWTGRNDSKGLKKILDSTGNKNVVTDVQSFAHNEIFAKDGSWKKGDWFAKPAGIQTLNVNGKTDIYPSWYAKPTNADGEKIVFDKVSKKRATDCTPAAAKIEIAVPVFEDAITKKKTYSPPDGYNPDASDDVHNCSDIAPFATVSVAGPPSKTVAISVNVNQGTFPLSSLSIVVDGQEIYNQPVGSSGVVGPISHTFSSSGEHTITATVHDTGLYQGTASTTKTIALNSGNNPFLPGRRRS